MHVDTKCRNNINQFKTTRCWFWTLKYLRSRRTETYARRCICCIANKTCETYSDLITNAQLWRCGNPQKKWKCLPTDCKRPTLRARTERLQLKTYNLIWLLWNPPLWTHERFCKRYFLKTACCKQCGVNVHNTRIAHPARSMQLFWFLPMFQAS